MNACYIGIDPGKAGGIAVICRNEVLGVTPMLITPKKNIDIVSTTEWIMSTIQDRASVAIIEQVSAMPGQGVTSMFRFGFVTGVMHGIIGALGIPTHQVTPQAWKKVILAGTRKDKAASIDFVMRVHPGISLLATTRSHTPHNGMSDAICIAMYAYRLKL